MAEYINYRSKFYSYLHTRFLFADIIKDSPYEKIDGMEISPLHTERQASKWPRLLDSPMPSPCIECLSKECSELLPLSCLLNHTNDSSKPDLSINCRGWRWACHRDVLAQRCAFFQSCCKGGFLVRSRPQQCFSAMVRLREILCLGDGVSKHQSG